MIHNQNWDEEIYSRVFDDICDYVEKRKQEDSNFSLPELGKMIDEAYIRRGMDWIGKGQLQFTIESATIAALEQQYITWKKNHQSHKK